jgi:hypothetical protein
MQKKNLEATFLPAIALLLQEKANNKRYINFTGEWPADSRHSSCWFMFCHPQNNIKTNEKCMRIFFYILSLHTGVWI